MNTHDDLLNYNEDMCFLPQDDIEDVCLQRNDDTVSTIGKKAENTSSGADADKETTEAEKQTTTERQTTATTEDSNKTTSGTTTERQTVTTTEAATQTTTQTSTASLTEPTTQVTTQAVTDATTAAQATTEARQTEETTQATTEATTTHQHNWVAVYKTVHHDREEIWGTCYQDIYETHTLCNGCGYDFTANGEPGIGSNCPNRCGAGTHGESVKVGTEERYEIIDIKPAYDEQVLDHYECTCGATKN